MRHVTCTDRHFGELPCCYVYSKQVSLKTCMTVHYWSFPGKCLLDSMGFKTEIVKAWL